MFKKILIANRGDQQPKAAQRRSQIACARLRARGDFAARAPNV
jgi:hypothetical protein